MNIDGFNSDVYKDALADLDTLVKADHVWDNTSQKGIKSQEGPESVSARQSDEPILMRQGNSSIRSQLDRIEDRIGEELGVTALGSEVIALERAVNKLNANSQEKAACLEYIR